MDSRLSSQIAVDTARLARLHRIDWSSLMSADLLLTGCTGPFGWWLLHRLSHAITHEGLRIDRVTLLTRQPAQVQEWVNRLHKGLNVRILEADIRDTGSRRLNATHVVHGATTSAAETSAGVSDQEKFDTIVDGTRALVRALDHCAPRRVVYVSSGISYGTSAAGFITEDSEFAPDTTQTSAAVGHAKRAAEFLMSCAAKRWHARLSIARCFSFSGPGLPLDLHYALGNFVAQATNAEPVTIKGDGMAVRSYMHLGDLAIWLLVMLTHKAQHPAVSLYNVGSDKAISIKELAELIVAAIQPGCEVQVLGAQRQNISGNHVSYYVPDITKARLELGVKLWTPLRESIIQTAISAQISRSVL